MQYYTSREGVELPKLVYGTAWKEDKTADLVEMALATGFRGVDTACQPKHYNEAGVGEGLARAFSSGIERSDVYIQTKFTPYPGHDPARVPYDPSAALADQVAQSFNTTQENLQMDQVDGLVLHSPLESHEQTMEVWGAMEELHGQGKVRQLGISNCYNFAEFLQLFESANVKPAVLQNRLYEETQFDFNLRRFCRENDVIYQSFWTLTANTDFLKSSEVTELSFRYEKTPAQIMYRFLTQNGVLPLTGTTSEQHMRDDLGIFEFEMNASELAQLNGLGPFF